MCGTPLDGNSGRRLHQSYDPTDLKCVSTGRSDSHLGCRRTKAEAVSSRVSLRGSESCAECDAELAKSHECRDAKRPLSAEHARAAFNCKVVVVVALLNCLMNQWFQKLSPWRSRAKKIVTACAS